MANPICGFPGHGFFEHEGFYCHSHYFGGFTLQAPSTCLDGGTKLFADSDGQLAFQFAHLLLRVFP